MLMIEYPSHFIQLWAHSNWITTIAHHCCSPLPLTIAAHSCVVKVFGEMGFGEMGMIAIWINLRAACITRDKINVLAAGSSVAGSCSKRP
ncbi:hypothetical protein C5167_007340 [Papaver somniferum]|nr:hypothetical protein C5167_007340 [Papaver somniferum]